MGNGISRRPLLCRYIHNLQCIDVTDEKNHPSKILEKQYKVRKQTNKKYFLRNKKKCGRVCFVGAGGGWGVEASKESFAYIYFSSPLFPDLSCTSGQPFLYSVARGKGRLSRPFVMK